MPGDQRSSLEPRIGQAPRREGKSFASLAQTAKARVMDDELLDQHLNMCPWRTNHKARTRVSALGRAFYSIPRQGYGSLRRQGRPWRDGARRHQPNTPHNNRTGGRS